MAVGRGINLSLKTRNLACDSSAASIRWMSGQDAGIMSATSPETSDIRIKKDAVTNKWCVMVAFRAIPTWLEYLGMFAKVDEALRVWLDEEWM